MGCVTPSRAMCAPRTRPRAIMSDFLPRFVNRSGHSMAQRGVTPVRERRVDRIDVTRLDVQHSSDAELLAAVRLLGPRLAILHHDVGIRDVHPHGIGRHLAGSDPREHQISLRELADDLLSLELELKRLVEADIDWTNQMESEGSLAELGKELAPKPGE